MFVHASSGSATYTHQGNHAHSGWLELKSVADTVYGFKYFSTYHKHTLKSIKRDPRSKICWHIRKRVESVISSLHTQEKVIVLVLFEKVAQKITSVADYSTR